MTKCPHAPEIKSRLLLPRYRALLWKYIDRWMLDPQFLLYHRDSTALALRQELGCSFFPKGPHCGCPHVRLAECCMVDTLKEVMEERLMAQESETI